MPGGDLRGSVFGRLAEPFTGEALFDCLPDMVYFIKDAAGRYVTVNQTLADRCRRPDKRGLLGRTPAEVFPAPFGERYQAQDAELLRTGKPLLHHLELHFYPSGRAGWCVTNKLPLRDAGGRVVGLVGVSKDLQTPGDSAADTRNVARAVEYAETHLDESLPIAQLAGLAGLSAYQLDHRIRRLFGLSVGQFVLKMRMDSAAQRLRDTDESVVSVALDCGYADQSSFARQFRQATGLTPGQYRRAVRKS